FCAHIQQTVATDPLASWVFIVDNLNIHSSESLVRHVARLEGIDESELRTKHSSWLNQVEVIFGIITRRILQRGNFTSTAALQERLLAFIDYFNRTFAKPFNWTYTGRPLA
ncbi:MAG TPA: transposase, partial [Pirellulales bacterium]|nr:transposase [Pirellulales bacterium]